MRRFLIISMSLMLKMSITGDTAKYLGFTLSRDGALFPQDSTCIEMIILRNNPSDHHGRVPSYHHYHQLSIWLSSCNLVGQGRAHMPCGCTGSFSTLNISNLFVPGWPSTSVIHKVNHRHGPCVTTQHKPIFPFHLGDSLTCCFINQKHRHKLCIVS